MFRAARQIPPWMRCVAVPAPFATAGEASRYELISAASVRCMWPASSVRPISQTLPMRIPRALEPLRHRDFRLLWTGQTVSAVGNFIHGVALPFQILALGGGALELGLWGAIFSVASLVFVLFGGAIADRFPRRAVILVTDFTAG